MLHTKFRGNWPNGPGEDFEGFLTYMGNGIYGHGGHLGHATNIMSLNFNFMYLEANIQNLRKACFNF